MKNITSLKCNIVVYELSRHKAYERREPIHIAVIETIRVFVFELAATDEELLIRAE